MENIKFVKENIKFAKENIKFWKENKKFAKENIKFAKGNIKFVKQKIKIVKEKIKFVKLAMKFVKDEVIFGGNKLHDYPSMKMKILMYIIKGKKISNDMFIFSENPCKNFLVFFSLYLAQHSLFLILQVKL